MLAVSLALLVMLGLALPSAAQHHYVPPEANLVVGQSVDVQLPSGGDTLRVTYRPSSSIARTDTIAATGGSSLQWTPRTAGVVQLATPQGASQDVTVQFDTLPISGIIILLVAGFILFGGASFAFRALFVSDSG